MKATEAKLLSFLQKSPQFVIPIYQRTYSWTDKQCRQLWDDILRAGSSDTIAVHFIGSIVYVEQGLSQVTHQAPLLVIDGQQRLTTVSLLIEAAGQVLMWQACSAWAALVVAAISGIGFSLVFPSMGVEAVRRLPPQNRGAAAGGCVAFFDLALGIGGPAAGLAATAFDYPAVFLVGAVSSLGAIGPALATRRGTPQAS